MATLVRNYSFTHCRMLPCHWPICERGQTKQAMQHIRQWQLMDETNNTSVYCINQQKAYWVMTWWWS